MREVDHDVERIRAAARGIAGKREEAIRVAVIYGRDVAPDVGGEIGRYGRDRRSGLAQVDLEVDPRCREWVAAAIPTEANGCDQARLAEFGVRVDLLVAHVICARLDGKIEGEAVG